MARVQGGGGGAGVAIVFFVGASFIGLVLAVLFYTQVSGAREGQALAEAELTKYVDRRQQESEEIKTLLGNRQGRQTVVGMLIEENRTLKELVSGDPTESATGLSQRVKADISGSLLDAISRLNAELADAATRVATEEQKAAQQKLRADAEQNASAAVKAAFGNSETQLKERLTQVTDDARQSQAQIGEMGNTLKAQMETMRSGLQTTNDQLVRDNDQLRQANSSLQKKIDDLINTESPQIPAITRADGRIISVLEAQNNVFIDRGKSDRLLRGMTFEIFNSGELVKLDAVGELRGKATIEVTGLDDNSAVARIVRRTRGTNLKDGDIIVNVAYDPNAILKFHIFGKFDIEGRGEASRADRKKVEAMIARWGGKLTKQLGPDVDFLVLGQEPPLPEQLAPGTTDPREITRYVEATRAHETYQNLRGEAQQLSVPILNQNRFLALVGYYQR